MRKTSYIIPGLGQTPKEIAYKEVSKFFGMKKIEPILVNISWKNRTMTDYVEQFMNIYGEDKNEDVYLFGFSFGAMISIISSVKIKPKLQILCSLSPYFSEDLKYIEADWKKSIGKKRIEDFRNYSFDELVKRINCRSIVVCGSEEYDICLRRARDASNKLSNNRLIIVKGAKHDISQKEYLQSLEEIILGIG